MNILITGGSGFIGRNIMEYFGSKENYSLFVPSSRDLNLLDEKAVRDYFRVRLKNLWITAGSLGAEQLLS